MALFVAIPVILVGMIFAALQWLGGGDDPETAPLPDASRQDAGPDGDAASVCGGAAPAPTAAPPEVSDWMPVVEDLYALRARAFQQLDPQLLCDVYSPTSGGLDADVQLIRDYADAGVRPTGLTFEVVSATLVDQEGGQVTLDITDRLPPYTLTDADGDVVGEKDGLPQASWQTVMLPASDGSGWRFG